MCCTSIRLRRGFRALGEPIALSYRERSSLTTCDVVVVHRYRSLEPVKTRCTSELYISSFLWRSLRSGCCSGTTLLAAVVASFCLIYSLIRMHSKTAGRQLRQAGSCQAAAVRPAVAAAFLHRGCKAARTPVVRVAAPEKAEAPVSLSSSEDAGLNDTTGVLLVQCPGRLQCSACCFQSADPKLPTRYQPGVLCTAADAKGVVASLAQLLFGFNCNIVQSDQFSDESLKPSRFFQVGGCVLESLPQPAWAYVCSNGITRVAHMHMGAYWLLSPLPVGHQ